MWDGKAPCLGFRCCTASTIFKISCFIPCRPKLFMWGLRCGALQKEEVGQMTFEIFLHGNTLVVGEEAAAAVQDDVRHQESNRPCRSIVVVAL